SIRDDRLRSRPRSFLLHTRRENIPFVPVRHLVTTTDPLSVVTEDCSAFSTPVTQDVPLGHKVALQDLANGTTVVKYGQDIGRVVAPIRKGEHVHTHNLKTKRW